MTIAWVASILTIFLLCCGMPKGVTTVIVLTTVVVIVALGVDEPSFA